MAEAKSTTTFTLKKGAATGKTEPRAEADEGLEPLQLPAHAGIASGTDEFSLPLSQAKA